MANQSDKTVSEALSRIYYGESVGALRGPAALYAQAAAEGVPTGRGALTLRKVKRWLSSQPVYSLYRPARRNYPRRRVTANFPGDVLQIDIMDMQRFKALNGYPYVLLAYDTYTKYLLAYPLFNRKPASVQHALEQILDSAPFRVEQIYWDKEGAFISRQIQAFLKARGVINYTTKSAVKAPGVERVIRTIRMAVQRHFEASDSQRWIDFLPTFVSNYNNRVHSTTKLKPREVIENPLLSPAQPAQPQPQAPAAAARKLPPIGSYVRLNRLRNVFEKEASGNYTDEVFRVKAHKTKGGIPQIFVTDLQGDDILGALYPQEYQPVDWDWTRRVEKVIRSRKRPGQSKENLVQYRGWPPKFNEWIPA